ncbi:MAG TPA: hypothetical protein VGO52_24255, partial [Hyphomonadaceae bacterium]|nr:hypothetical protein [Hyphomonadaceae bacterium]
MNPGLIIIEAVKRPPRTARPIAARATVIPEFAPANIRDPGAATAALLALGPGSQAYALGRDDRLVPDRRAHRG